WTLTYGIRWSEDKKDITQDAIDLLGTTSGATGVPLILPEFAAPVEADDSWSDTTNKFSASYSPTDNLMFYATYSEGFKSGAFPSQANLPEVAATSVDPETVTNIEGGFKSSWWDNKVQFNASYYDMDYDDLQVFELSSRLLLVLTNAQAETKGVDVDFNILLMDDLMLSTSYNYSDATYTEFTDVNGNDVSGNDMVFAPEQAFAIDVDYRFDLQSAGTLDFNVAYNWKDAYYTSVSNADKTRQQAVGMLGASVTWSDSQESWTATLWGKNLRDEQQIASRIVDPTAITSESYMAPETYGITVAKRF
ncbi:MAG: TonB-dependent receptor domain-containing protein, partial [Halioglobus sp.]